MWTYMESSNDKLDCEPCQGIENRRRWRGRSVEDIRPHPSCLILRDGHVRLRGHESGRFDKLKLTRTTGTSHLSLLHHSTLLRMLKWTKSMKKATNIPSNSKKQRSLIVLRSDYQCGLLRAPSSSHRSRRQICRRVCLFEKDHRRSWPWNLYGSH